MIYRRHNTVSHTQCRRLYRTPLSKHKLIQKVVPVWTEVVEDIPLWRSGIKPDDHRSSKNGRCFRYLGIQFRDACYTQRKKPASVISLDVTRAISSSLTYEGKKTYACEAQRGNSRILQSRYSKSKFPIVQGVGLPIGYQHLFHSNFSSARSQSCGSVGSPADSTVAENTPSKRIAPILDGDVATGLRKKGQEFQQASEVNILFGVACLVWSSDLA